MSGSGATSEGKTNVDRFIDVNKHMTTLGAGAVVLMATFMKDIFPKADDGSLSLPTAMSYMLGFSLLSFGLTVFVSVSLLLYATSSQSPGFHVMRLLTGVAGHLFFLWHSDFWLCRFRHRCPGSGFSGFLSRPCSAQSPRPVRCNVASANICRAAGDNHLHHQRACNIVLPRIHLPLTSVNNPSPG
jgi:hypothetical protein